MMKEFVFKDESFEIEPPPTRPDRRRDAGGPEKRILAVTYLADGSFSARSKIRIMGVNTSVDYKGKWEILSGPAFRLKVTKTSNRLYVPNGKVYLMKGFQIKGDRMSYTHENKPGSEARQKPAKK